MATTDAWLALVQHTPLGILTDLDGTLLPFARTPEEAVPADDLRALVADLAALPGVAFAIVSGRKRETLDQFFPAGPLVVAEHGAWRRDADGWQRTVVLDDGAIDPLAAELRRLQARHPASLLERKTWSVAFHFRRVPPIEKPELLVEVGAIVAPWLDANPDFEPLRGSEVIEVRPRTARKGSAVDWIQSRLGANARLVVLGDDVTDEDMFAAVGPDDAAILVSAETGRATAAKWRLPSTDDAHAFLRSIVSSRRHAANAMGATPSSRPSRVEASPGAGYGLLVVSNRLPELRSAVEPHARKRNVGGLVSALEPVLAAKKGVWLGWSGRTRAGASASSFGVDAEGALALAWVDFPDAWHRHYYNGTSNGALWPLMHSFPSKVVLAREDWAAYEEANDAFAAAATKLVASDATAWVHDYHLLLLGARMRARGHTGRIGYFQHIPFPSADILFILPKAAEVLEAMLAYDLVGFHTRPYVENFLRCAATVEGARVDGDTITFKGHATRVGAFPLGIIAGDFQEPDDAETSEEIAGLMRSMHQAKMVLGVDRLDYTKGIPERIAAFGRLLETRREWRKNVCLVQVSVPSRADVPEYVEQRSRIENIVGRINGEFGEADWVPIRYLYRSYGRRQLSALYRAARVGYVTPLRDGMNLVAKEFVAAQDPSDPGVLVLSRFAGAAEELKDALLTNPWDPDGTADQLDVALRMEKEERVRRHAALLAVVSKTTAVTWAESFLSALAQ